MAPAVLDYSATGRVAGRDGNRDPGCCPHGVFRCAGEDEWCAIAVRSDAEWEALCRLLGRPELGRHPDFATLAARKVREAEVEAHVAEWSAGQDKRALMERLQAAGIPAGYVAKASDLFDDPQLAHRRAFVPLPHAEVGELRGNTLPFQLSAAPTAPRASGPLLGEHTDAVLRDLLGYNAAEIAAFRAEGVLK
jgi:benzylsuccinate CoA-transferase BbsF subunit